MKRTLIHLSIAAMMTVLLMPAVANAQKEDKVKDKADKEKKEREQITIIHKGDKDGKVVVEFKDGKVIVNGKSVDEFKDDNVTIHRNRIQNLRAYTPGNGTMNFGEGFGENLSLFNEDENRAMLGVTTEKVDEGAEIQEISKASAAEKSGLKEGDIIKKVGDTKIEDADDLSKAIRSHKPGEKVTITYLRDKKEQKVTVELGKWKGVNFNFKSPDMNFEMPHADVFSPSMPRIRGNQMWYGGAPKLGLSVQDTDEGKGVKVIEVDEESNAAKAGVKEDDVITHVNDKEVNTTDDITKIVKDSKDKNSLMLKLNRGGKTQNIEVKMPKKIKTADL